MRERERDEMDGREREREREREAKWTQSDRQPARQTDRHRQTDRPH